MLTQPDPSSNVAFDVVFTSKKSGVLVEDRVAKRYHRTTWVRISIVPIVLHVLHISQIGHRRGVLRVSMFFRKESSYSWMDGLRMVKVYWEPKGMCGNKVFGCFQPRQGLNVTSNKQCTNEPHGGSRLVLAG